jgi:shikimate kinase
MNIVVVEKEISLVDLKGVAQEFYKTMVKGVVDIEREIVAFGGEYHIDANQKLIESNSEQKNIWGFNIYLDRPRDTWIEYISLINIRPSAGNTDMEVSDPKIREKMKRIIDSKII